MTSGPLRVASGSLAFAVLMAAAAAMAQQSGEPGSGTAPAAAAAGTQTSGAPAGAEASAGGTGQEAAEEAHREARLLQHWCQAHARHFMERMLRGIQRGVEFTPQQKATFEQLSSAVVKARDTLASACPAQRFYTPNAELDAEGKRLEARLEAIRTVQPLLDKFYTSLSDEQKARYAAMDQERHEPWAAGRPDFDEGGGTGIMAGGAGSAPTVMAGTAMPEAATSGLTGGTATIGVATATTRTDQEPGRPRL
jgi:hypothetical protein